MSGYDVAVIGGRAAGMAARWPCDVLLCPHPGMVFAARDTDDARLGEDSSPAIVGDPDEPWSSATPVEAP